LPDVATAEFAVLTDEDVDAVGRLQSLEDAVDKARTEFWRADRASIESRVDPGDGSSGRFDRDALRRRDAALTACERAAAERDAARDPKA